MPLGGGGGGFGSGGGGGGGSYVPTLTGVTRIAGTTSTAAPITYLNVMDFGADNTGTNYNDTAFNAAIVEAQTILQYGQANDVIISGPAGKYKLGQYTGLMIPNGVRFGNFGGGGYGSAEFYFPTQTNQPMVIATVSSETTTTATLTGVTPYNGSPMSFPVSGSTPQSVIIGYGCYTYTGVTSNGTSTPTLTGISPALSGEVGQNVYAGAAILIGASGGSNETSWTLDRTIHVVGPGSGFTFFQTTTTGSVTPGTTTSIPLTSVTGLPTGGCQMMIVGPNNIPQPFSYTGISSLTLTGVTWVSGMNTTVISSGGEVINITPPNTMDGIYVGTEGAIDCLVSNFRHATVMCHDHEQWGPNFSPSGCYSGVCVAAPNVSNYPADDSGNQTFHAGINWAQCQWAPIYITAYNDLNNATFYGGNTWGECPWGFMWKEATKGVTNGVPSAIVAQSILHDAAFEAMTLGIIGCPDVNAVVQMTFDNCSIGWDTAQAWAPIAEFTAQGLTLNIIGGDMFSSLSPNSDANTPFFVADHVTGQITNTTEMNRFVAGRAVIGTAPGYATSSPLYWLPFPGGLITASAQSVPAGAVCKATTLINSSFSNQATSVFTDDQTSGVIIGVAVAAFTHSVGYIGALATSALYGPVNVSVHTGGDITANSLVMSNGATSAGTAKSVSTAAGALAAGTGAPPKFTESRTFSISGLIAVPSGATNFIPPFFEPVDSGVTKKIIGVRCEVRGGTSATFAVNQNGSPVSGLSSVTASTAAAYTAATVPPSVTDGDVFAIVVASISGTPDGLTVSLIFETTPTTTQNGVVFARALAADSGGVAQVALSPALL